MSALMEPDDDGTTREAAGGIHQITRGRFLYTSFPVQWDNEGRCAAVALDAYDTETGARDFAIVAPGAVNGCACADCAPHEQVGPVPIEYVSRLVWNPVQERQQCAASTRAGTRCNAMTGHPSGYCGHHKRHRAKGSA